MSVFFLGSWGMNQTAGQTNCVNCEAEPNKIDIHSLFIFTMLQQRPFLNFSEKSYKIKTPAVMAT